MIETVIFTVVMLAVGYAVPALFHRCMVKTVTCRCGALATRAAIILDLHDEDRLRATLSEGCPLCRMSAAEHTLVTGRPAANGFPAHPALSQSPEATDAVH